ncbi:MAG TPA: sulfite exporter TauE/SafE family protein [Methanomassiliicoccales archaeon]|nr:sulfite exporter TauE/SafE family protein [Methanomassiliicoccales archaeon]
MEPLVLLLIALLCVSAGTVGALMGIGGGLIIIPLLTLGFGIPMQEAIGASLIGVIATSTGAASKYVKQGLTNIRLALFLEMSTTIGSIVGALIAVYTDQTILFLLFSMLLVYAGYTMLRRTERLFTPEQAEAEGQLVDLSCQFMDPKDSCQVSYGVKGQKKGLAYSSVAGLLSGLLGVGGGLVKVPVMNVCMCVPLKAATATSNFMIGVTALTGAIIFYGHGLLDAYLCGAVALGTFAGAYLGTRLMARYSANELRKWFSVLLFLVAVTMVLKAFGLWGGS